MPYSAVIRTEVRGFDLCLDGTALSLAQSGDNLVGPITLVVDDADRVRIEMAKAQLWEWNQLEELKSRAELRYRRYFGSWLVMCLAAFSAYLGYPSYYLCLLFALLSILLWWRAGFVEQKADRAAQAERNAFRPERSYLRQRLEQASENEDAAPR